MVAETMAGEYVSRGPYRLYLDKESPGYHELENLGMTVENAGVPIVIGLIDDGHSLGVGCDAIMGRLSIKRALEKILNDQH
jgi:hypothetical protein